MPILDSNNPKEIETITLKINRKLPFLSEIFVNEEKIQNITSLKIEAAVDGKEALISFTTLGEGLVSGLAAKEWSVLSQSQCPACGFPNENNKREETPSS